MNIIVIDVDGITWGYFKAFGVLPNPNPILTMELEECYTVENNTDASNLANGLVLSFGYNDAYAIDDSSFSSNPSSKPPKPF